MLFGDNFKNEQKILSNWVPCSKWAGWHITRIWPGTRQI